MAPVVFKRLSIGINADFLKSNLDGQRQATETHVSDYSLQININTH